MRLKRNKTLCILLAITISISGVSFKNIQLDSLLTFTLLQHADPYINSIHDTIKNFHACTTEMLGIQNTHFTKLLATRSFPQKRISQKTFTNIISSNIISSQEGIFFIASNIRKIYIYYSDLFTTDYIHNSDGKKRF